MSWGTEEDVDRIVRARLKEIRAKHKREVERLKKKIVELQAENDHMHDEIASHLGG